VCGGLLGRNNVITRARGNHVVADERMAGLVSSAGPRSAEALGEGILALRGGNGDRLRRHHKADAV
jgi:hypothetical protein